MGPHEDPLTAATYADAATAGAWRHTSALTHSWAVGGELAAQFEGSGWQALVPPRQRRDGRGPPPSIVDDALEALGAALGSIVNLTNPQRIVMGGWVGIRLLERYADRILDAIRRNSLTRLAEQFELASATFGGDTVALGAALMPIEALINAPRLTPRDGQ